MENKKIRDQSTSTQAKYKNDPEFRERHKKYVTEKIECDCGKKISRCNMALHKKTKSHTSYLDGGLSKTSNKTIKTLLELKKILTSLNSVNLKIVNSEIDNQIQNLLNN